MTRIKRRPDAERRRLVLAALTLADAMDAATVGDLTGMEYDAAATTLRGMAASDLVDRGMPNRRDVARGHVPNAYLYRLTDQGRAAFAEVLGA